MPFWQFLALGQQSIGAGGRQPVWIFQLFQGNGHTVGDAYRSIGIICALAGVRVQQTTVYIGKIDFPGICVFQSVQAAFCTAITQGFPLIRIQFCQGDVFPEFVLLGFHGRQLYLETLFRFTHSTWRRGELRVVTNYCKSSILIMCNNLMILKGKNKIV